MGYLVVVVFCIQIVLIVLTAIYYAFRLRRKYQPELAEISPIAGELISFSVILAKLSVEEFRQSLTILEVCRRGHEVIFCAEHSDEDSVKFVQRHLGPGMDNVKVVFQPGPYGPNPKVDMMKRCLGVASNDIVAFVDGNTKIGPELDRRIQAAWVNTDCLVSTLPVTEQANSFWTSVESALLNRIYTRWIIAGNAFGFPTAFGKLLVFRKSWLMKNGGPERLADCYAEDTAIWRLANNCGLETRHITPAVTSVLRGRSRSAVLGRAQRWPMLRRHDLPFVFAFEALYTQCSILVTGSITATVFGWHIGMTLIALVILWHVLEALMAVASREGWRAAIHLHAITRDAIMVYYWLKACFSDQYRWRS